MGELEKTDDGYYVYTSNAENEELLLVQGFLSLHGYNLWGSQGRKSKELFQEFKRFVAQAKRADIVKRAGINPEDSEWERLVKLSKLSFFPTGFYVQKAE